MGFFTPSETAEANDAYVPMMPYTIDTTLPPLRDSWIEESILQEIEGEN